MPAPIHPRHARRRAEQHEVLQPPGWPQPKGYANGIKARGEFMFVGGMVGWDEQERFPEGFVRAGAAGAAEHRRGAGRGRRRPEHIVRLTWYVLDMDEYLAARNDLGAAYRAVLGEHFPAMALVQVGAAVRAARRGSRSRRRRCCHSAPVELGRERPVGQETIIADPSAPSSILIDRSRAGKAVRPHCRICGLGAVFRHDLWGDQPDREQDAEWHHNEIVDVAQHRDEIRNEIDRRQRVGGDSRPRPPWRTMAPSGRALRVRPQ